MLRYMLDTNTVIHTMRAEPTARIVGRLNRFASQVCISTIVLAELRHGAERSARVAENLLEIERFSEQLQAILDFDVRAAIDYGRLRAELRAQPIGPLDTLIAAHARSQTLVLVTANRSEFDRVPGLQVEDWDD